MRIARKTRKTTVTADTTIVTTAETVAATLAGVSTDRPDMEVLLSGWCQLTTGASVTSCVLRIRRGTDATGTLIGEGNLCAAAASAADSFDIEVKDTPGEGSFTYVLTVVQTAATGNGTVTQASLQAQA